MHNNSYCKVGTNTLESYKGGAAFRYGSIMMVDPRHPSVSLTMQVDHTSAHSEFFGKSIKNERKVVTYLDGDKYKESDYVTRKACEGSMLTFVGKISYDIDNDLFVLKDSLGVIGGGFTDTY